MSLFIVYATLAHLSGVFSRPNEVSYMDAVYPVFRYFSISFTNKKENSFFSPLYLFFTLILP